MPDAAKKLDAGKNRLDLISALATEELGRVLTFGIEKYSEHNWRKGLAWGRVLAASLRHLVAFARGEDRDPETGLLHTAHAMACCMFLVEFQLLKRGTDDRWRAEAVEPPSEARKPWSAVEHGPGICSGPGHCLDCS